MIKVGTPCNFIFTFAQHHKKSFLDRPFSKLFNELLSIYHIISGKHLDNKHTITYIVLCLGSNVKLGCPIEFLIGLI